MSKQLSSESRSTPNTLKKGPRHGRSLAKEKKHTVRVQMYFSRGKHLFSGADTELYILVLHYIPNPDYDFTGSSTVSKYRAARSFPSAVAVPSVLEPQCPTGRSPNRDA